MVIRNENDVPWETDARDVWTIDADNIDFQDLNVEDLVKYVVMTPQVRAYLRVGHKDKKLILVAPKGLGKTLLLKAKSHMYRKLDKSYRCIPRGTTLVERLVIVNSGFSIEDLNKFKEIEIWRQLWELSLCTLILTHFDPGSIPEEIRQIQGAAKSLFNIVHNFLGERQAINRIYENNISKYLNPQIGRLGNIAVFIDNIDEGLSQHSGENLKRHVTRGTVSEDVWINAQLALMHVIRNICSTNTHIKIFAAVRSEAANCDKAPTTRQLRKDYCIDLTYSKKQIQEIFENTIRLTSKDSLKNPRSGDPIEAFLGFKTLPHKFVKVDSAPRIEDVFDFIYRHTFERPRDIVSMGKELCGIPPAERTVEVVREIVNLESNNLLEGYKMEIIPYFEENVFDFFCDVANKNVINAEKRKIISDQIETLFDFPHVFTYLYSLGLVGAVVSVVGEGRKRQEFLQVGQYSFSTKQDPKASEYFVLHSSIDKILKTKHEEGFYDKSNIIGNGYDFQVPGNEKPLHVHFGLGRDSLSLILPELCRSKTVAIAQEPHSDFFEFAAVENFILENNLYDPIRFKVINKGTQKGQVDELFNAWKKGEHILLYHSQHMSRFINECETITIEGKASLSRKAINRIDPSSSRKFLYLCRRFLTKDSIKEITDLVENSKLGDNVYVGSSLIDRLTLTEPTREVDVNTVTYHIEAEKFGRIIVKRREGSENEENNIIHRTRNVREQAYFEDQQKLLVEGIYRLTKIIRSELPGKKRNNINLIYDVFFDIQISRLLSTYSKDELLDFFDLTTSENPITKLLKLCSETKERFVTMNKFPGYTSGVESYVEEAKKLGIFPPKDNNFYHHVKKSGKYSNNSAVRKLQDLIGIEPLKDFRSVFISFTEGDKEFASQISDCLKKRGVDTYYYHDDPRHGEKREIEEKEINRRDRILFIASKNSLTSNECHQELSFGIQKKRNLISQGKITQELRDIFIPIKLDNFVLKPDKELMETLEGEVHNPQIALDNIKFIQNTAIQDFANYRKKKVNKAFEARIDEYIMPALIRKSQ